MYVYLIAFGISALLAHGLKKIKRLHIYVKAFISCIPVLLIAGLRYDVGTDFFSYRTFFFDVNYLNNTEVLFKWIRDLISRYTHGNFDVFIFVTSFLFIFTIYISIWEQSESVELSIFFFMTNTLFYIGMNTIRQGIAISIVLFSLKFLRENKKFSFMAGVLFACLWHSSVIICLCFLFAKQIRIDFWKGILLLTVFFTIGNSIAGIVARCFEGSKYYHFFYDNYGVDIPVTYMAMTFLVFLLASYIKSIKSVNGIFDLYYNILFLAMAVGTFTGWLPMGKRIMWNFMFVMIYLCPMSIHYLTGIMNKRILTLLYCLFFFAAMYSNIVLNHDHGCIPYNWIL